MPKRNLSEANILKSRSRILPGKKVRNRKTGPVSTCISGGGGGLKSGAQLYFSTEHCTMYIAQQLVPALGKCFYSLVGILYS